MNLAGNITLNANSILLMIVLLYQSAKHGEKDSLQNKLFVFVVWATAILLLIDCFSRFDGNLHTVFPYFNHAGNFLIFLLSPVLPCCWLLYTHIQVFHDEKRTLRLLYPIFAVGAANAALTVLTQFFGWYYTIDAGNIYHRGPLFWLPATITIVLLLCTYAMLAANRMNIERKYYRTLVFFAVPPLACIALQILFYGMSLMLNSVALSILIVYFNIQNGSMYIDYLTGVNNRKKLELHLKERINGSSGKSTFSAILVDLDNFKAINDTYGHAVGDEALETAAKLLKSCLRHNDFVARFGGDEFYIILDISDESGLESAVERLEACIAKHNEHSSKPYSISFSMGYAVYDPSTRMKADEFQKRLDSLMYENKRANKALTSPVRSDSLSEPPGRQPRLR